MGGMTREEARKALLTIAEEADMQAARSSVRSRPFFSLISSFAKSASKRAHPKQVPDIIASYRRIWAVGVMVERRAQG